MTIFLTAIALQRACTQSWGRAAAPDGSSFELTVVGLSRLGTASGATRIDCRWWPRYGDASLCAPTPDGTAAHQRLQRAYPMLQVALWLAVASLFFQALRIPRQRLLQVAVPTAACALSGSAILFVVRGARHALAALATSTIDFALPGFIAAVAAFVLSATSALLLAESFQASPEA